MTESPNKRVYRRFVDEVINGGDTSVISELYHPDYIDHSAPPGAPSGLSVFDQVAGVQKMFRGAFPDVHFTIDSMVEEGDWVGTRVTGEAQHIGGPFMGIAPSGRRVVWSSFGMFRIEDGRIAEHYGQPDLLGLREQLALKAEPGSLDENRAIVSAYVYNTNLGNFDAFDEFVVPDYVDNDPIPGQKSGREGLKDAYRMFLAAFPDVWFTFEDLIAEGDLVVGRGVIKGTHKGDFLGIPPSGKELHWTGTRMFRVRNGKVVEGWINLDFLGLMQQMGAIPAPPPAPPAAPSSSRLRGAPSTPADNAALMRRFIDEVWNKGNFEVADEIFHPEATSPSAPSLPPGGAGVRVIAEMFRNAFPDYRMEITHLVAEDSRVAARFRQGGTHKGDLMGIAPTGKRVEWTEIGILRIADGKVVESWYDVDMLGLMGQLGVGGGGGSNGSGQPAGVAPAGAAAREG